MLWSFCFLYTFPPILKTNNLMKTVLISGAAGNLGQTVVRRFAAEGYRVLALVSPGKTLGYTVDGVVHVYDVDLTREAVVQSCLAMLVQEHGRIDAALLLAGGFAMGDLHATDGTALMTMFQVNFYTAYHLVRAVYAHFDQHSGGRFVLVGARPGLDAQAGQQMVAYGLSKSLVFQLADYVNATGNARNITAAVVVPGTLDTPANRKAMPQADFSQWVSTDDVASGMLYLCSAAGQALREPVLKLYNRS